MTLRELSQLYWLTREIENEKERLRRLESRAYAVGAAPVGNVPRASEVSRKTERYAVAIANSRQSIQDGIDRCEVERAKLLKYIAGIDESLTREIFRLRFAESLSWAEVAAKVGGGNTVDGVRQRVYRYLREHP